MTCLRLEQLRDSPLQDVHLSFALIQAGPQDRDRVSARGGSRPTDFVKTVQSIGDSVGSQQRLLSRPLGLGLGLGLVQTPRQHAQHVLQRGDEVRRLSQLLLLPVHEVTACRQFPVARPQLLAQLRDAPFARSQLPAQQPSSPALVAPILLLVLLVLLDLLVLLGIAAPVPADVVPAVAEGPLRDGLRLGGRRRAPPGVAAAPDVIFLVRVGAALLGLVEALDCLDEVVLREARRLEGRVLERVVEEIPA